MASAGHGRDQPVQRVEAAAAERDIIGRGLGQAHEHLGRADAAHRRRLAEAREQDQRRPRPLPHPRERLRIGAHVADRRPWACRRAAGRSGRPSTSASITAIAPFLRLTARGKGSSSAARHVEQSEFVAHQPPAALAEQSRQGRFAGARFAGHDERAAVLLDRRGVEQQIALLPQRHLQVHAHLGGEQAVGERQRRGVGQDIIAPDRDRRPETAPPGLFRLEPDGEVAKPVRAAPDRRHRAARARRAAPARPSRCGSRPGRSGGRAGASCAAHQAGRLQLVEPGVDRLVGLLAFEVVTRAAAGAAARRRRRARRAACRGSPAPARRRYGSCPRLRGTAPTGRRARRVRTALRGIGDVDGGRPWAGAVRLSAASAARRSR